MIDPSMANQNSSSSPCRIEDVEIDDNLDDRHNEEFLRPRSLHKSREDLDQTCSID